MNSFWPSKKEDIPWFRTILLLVELYDGFSFKIVWSFLIEFLISVTFLVKFLGVENRCEEVERVHFLFFYCRVFFRLIPIIFLFKLFETLSKVRGALVADPDCNPSY